MILSFSKTISFKFFELCDRYSVKNCVVKKNNRTVPLLNKPLQRLSNVFVKSRYVRDIDEINKKIFILSNSSPYTDKSGTLFFCKTARC